MRPVSKNVGCESCSSLSKGIFCDVEAQELASVSQNKVMNSYKKGHTIFYQGNPPFGLYCINSGKIKITQVGSEGKESILRIAAAGDVLGHRSLFCDEKYNATATVIEDATICFLDKKFIYKAIEEQPTVAFNLIQKLSRDMGASETRNAAMAQRNVRERLAELLLTLNKSYGVKEERGLRLDIKLTREEIASMIGTASETVIRLITEFKEEKLIEQESKVIYIIDEKRLIEFANLNY